MTETTRKFAIGQSISVKTPGRYSKVLTGTVHSGDENFIYYTVAGDEKVRKTRRGAIQPDAEAGASSLLG